MLVRRRIHIASDEDSDHEGIDSDDSSHDHRYEGLFAKSILERVLSPFLGLAHLHDQIWPEGADSCNPDP